MSVITSVHADTLAARPDIEYALPPLPEQTAEAPLSWRERLWARAGVRKLFILALLALLGAGRAPDRQRPAAAGRLADRAGFRRRPGQRRAGARRAVAAGAGAGYVAGVALAFALTTLAVSTRLGRDLLSTLTSMFNPLPAIALLPLALLWFGLGEGSLVFVLIHSVLWALALNTYAGFLGVSETLRMAGRNYG